MKSEACLQAEGCHLKKFWDLDKNDFMKHIHLKLICCLSLYKQNLAEQLKNRYQFVHLIEAQACKLITCTLRDYSKVIDF